MSLVADATGVRHAIVAPPIHVPQTAADPPGIVHASVARDDEPSRSAGGGAGHTVEAAELAAVGEALERFAATHATLPVRRATSVTEEPSIRLCDWTMHSDVQRRDPAFPHARAYPDDEWMTPVFDLATNERVWVPAALVSLTTEYGALATSSGLAAAPSVMTALLRATEELVERDAYVTTWMHQLAGREVHWNPDGFGALGSTMRVFDLTPTFSPHPVAMVTGSAPRAGTPRMSLGLACRATWMAAVDKAALECAQGVVFAGHLLGLQPALRGLPPQAVTGFDEHAVFYSANPTWWDALPVHAGAAPSPRPPDAPTAADAEAAQLAALVARLRHAGARLYYRELSTVDIRQLGIRVVRVLSPDLTPLHHDHRWPFLGGRAGDVAWRYPDWAERQHDRQWPSPFPHGLG